MPTDENRSAIDTWIAVSPDTRIVKTTQRGDRWTTQAIEDGEVRYEETELRDEPELNLLAAWCERQGRRVEPRPPVKTSHAHGLPLARKQQR